MALEKEIALAAGRAAKALYGIDTKPEDVVVQPTRKDFEGNLTVVVFPWAKAARKSPAEVGREIGDWLVENEPAVSRTNAVGGFLNIVIEPTYWTSVLAEILKTPAFGIKTPAPDAPLVMVEYSSPNTNKPLHLGHVRNNLLGHSISEILKACGYRVVKTNIVNDRGIHICKSMLAWLKWGDGATPESTGKKGDHLIGDFYVAFDKHYKAEVKQLMDEKHISLEEAEKASSLMAEARGMLVKWEAKDPEVRRIWEMMNSWVYAGFDQTYRRMGVTFDKIYYESDTYLVGKQKVLEGLEKGLMYRKEDGSVWADLTSEGLDHKLLLRSDGTSVYMTQDIGTAQLRFADYPIDKMIYVVGNEQDYHFKVLSLLLDRLGFAWGKDLVHFSYGMVELPDGKMKSREGTVVDADDLFDSLVVTAREAATAPGRLVGLTPEEVDHVAEIVGLGALKYFLLKVDPVKNTTFNPHESIDFNGNTGPFIQYTYARIRSVLRKAAEQGFDSSAASFAGVIPSEKETTLIQTLAAFPATVSDAGRRYSPAVIANYAYEVAKQYNQFYHDSPILREDDTHVRALRLALSDATARVLKEATRLLGMEVPERM